MDVLAPRYADLLGQVPSGSFYDADGTILPWTNDQYEFRLTTNAANTTYAVIVNDIKVSPHLLGPWP
jgi:hypothetical protein